MKISTILDHIDSGHMALPEFQRGYVWNRDQVRGRDAESLLGEAGLIGQLKKQLAERMLSAELNHHLASERAAGEPPGNHQHQQFSRIDLEPLIEETNQVNVRRLIHRRLTNDRGPGYPCPWSPSGTGFRRPG